jgi:tRNA pseudouridine38-40 synthase
MEASVECNHRMELQYDGTGLHGWAKQVGPLTVEGCLEKAFQTALGSAPTLRVAGRTDAGVHARRQVVSLALPAGVNLPGLRNSLNALTPPGIVVTRIAPAPQLFDARRDATSRIYRYYLTTLPVVSPFWVRYCWRAANTLDMVALAAAAGATVGRHDLTAFTPTETEHSYFGREILRCVWKRASGGFPVGGGAMIGATGARTTDGGTGMMYLEIEADSFLRHMVRALVGTMAEVAEGKRSLESYRLLLDGAPREEAGRTAPAHGLFLWDVKYSRR